MKEKAAQYFNNGYSCSEAVVKAAIDEGLCDSNLLPCATSFSGGLSYGCLCGAIAGAQLVLGNNFGRDNTRSGQLQAREKAYQLMEEFVKQYKFTCCRILTKGQEGPAKKQACTQKVSDCAETLEKLLKIKV